MTSPPSVGSQTAPSARQFNYWRLLGWAAWVIPLLAIAIMVAARPQKRTVTPLYHAAVQRWWHQQPLYDGPGGMNYLPQFAILFGPYEAPPFVVGDILWRCTAAAGFAAGLWLFAAAVSREDRWRTFCLLSLLMLPLTLPAIRNGQANAHLGAAFLLAACALRAERWWLATLLLCLGIAIKPLGIAAAGLAFIAYPRLWWRLGLGLLILLVFPFLFGPPDYVWSQFLACRENLRQCSQVTEHRFADINGLLRTFGVPLSGKTSLAIRGLAGAALAVLCFLAKRRCLPHQRSLIWLGASAGFLMLFNPMTEANSYAIFAPVLALFALLFASEEKPFLAYVLAFMVLSMGLLPNLLRPWLGNCFALAWHPTMTLVFLSILAWRVLRSSLSEHQPPKASPLQSATVS